MEEQLNRLREEAEYTFCLFEEYKIQQENNVNFLNFSILPHDLLQMNVLLLQNKEMEAEAQKSESRISNLEKQLEMANLELHRALNQASIVKAQKVSSDILSKIITKINYQIEAFKKQRKCVSEEFQHFCASMCEAISKINDLVSQHSQYLEIVPSLNKCICVLQEKNLSLTLAQEEQDAVSKKFKDELDSWKEEFKVIADNNGISGSSEDDSPFSQFSSVLYILDDMSADLSVLREENINLKSEISQLKEMNKELTDYTTKLKDEIDLIDATRREKDSLIESLRLENENEKQNNKRLNEQNTFLLGHQNPNQKIQHIKQLKDEVNSFKRKCREQEILMRKYKKLCGRSLELDEEELNSLQIDKKGVSDENTSPKPHRVHQSSSSKRYNLRNH